MTNITDVGDLIDTGIVNFIEYMEQVSFSKALVIVKVLEMEQGRTVLLKENTYEGMENLVDDPEELDRLSREFIQIYIVEQKIQDRIDIAREYVKRKGVL